MLSILTSGEVSSAACRSRTGENAIIPLEPEARFEIWNDWGGFAQATKCTCRLEQGSSLVRKCLLIPAIIRVRVAAPLVRQRGSAPVQLNATTASTIVTSPGHRRLSIE